MKIHVGVCHNWTGGVGNTDTVTRCLSHICFYFSLSVYKLDSRGVKLRTLPALAVNLDFLPASVTILLSIIDILSSHVAIIAIIVDIRAVCSEFINQRE